MFIPRLAGEHCKDFCFTLLPTKVERHFVANITYIHYRDRIKRSTSKRCYKGKKSEVSTFTPDDSV